MSSAIDAIRAKQSQQNPDPSAQPQSTPAPQSAAPAQSGGSQDSDSSLLPEDESGEPVKIQKSFSALNEKLQELLDGSGVKRSFTIPYIDGQAMDEHVQAIGAAATNSGGLTNNLLTTAHHSGGKGWGSGDGHTVGHPAESLRSTIIPKGSEQAKAVIAAAKRLLNQIGSLLGESDPSIKVAKSQINLVGKYSGEGMNLLDFAIAVIQISHKPLQALARAHSGNKDGGHSPALRAPNPGSSAQPQES